MGPLLPIIDLGNLGMKPVLSTLVTTWLLNIAIHLRHIRLQTLVAIDSEPRPTSLPSFYALPPEVAVLFYSNLSCRPAATAADAETPCVCARPSYPRKAELESGPKSLAVDFAD